MNRYFQHLLKSFWFLCIIMNCIKRDFVYSINIKCSKNNFNCNEPQLRSLKVSSEMNTTFETEPYMIVLSRCDEGTGCCPKGYTCQMKTSEPVEFIVLQIYPGNGENTSKKVLHKFKNHTLCTCEKDNDNIK